MPARRAAWIRIQRGVEKPVPTASVIPRVTPECTIEPTQRGLFDIGDVAPDRGTGDTERNNHRQTRESATWSEGGGGKVRLARVNLTRAYIAYLIYQGTTRETSAPPTLQSEYSVNKSASLISRKFKDGQRGSSTIGRPRVISVDTKSREIVPGFFARFVSCNRCDLDAFLKPPNDASGASLIGNRRFRLCRVPA